MSRPLASLVLLAGVGLSAGCVDYFVPQVPPEATRFVGASDEGFRKPDCPPMSFDLAIFKSPITDVDRIAGRATTAATGTGLSSDLLRGLWVEGFIDADNMAEFEVRNHPVSTTEVATYWLWRGTRQADGSLSLNEPEPSCGRSVQLAAK